MPSNRKLVPLANYDAALDEVSWVGTILGLLALIFLLLIVAAALPHMDRNLPRGPDRWLTVMSVTAAVMAIGSPAVLWLVGSYRRNMEQAPTLVCPTCHQVPWSSRGVRLTGCCDRCGAPMLELPDDPSRSIPKSTTELSENHRAVTRGLLGCLFVGLCAFGLAIGLFASTGNFTYLAMSGPAFLVTFLPGVLFVDRKSKRQTFECPNCKVDLKQNPKTIAWITTTGRCAKCAHVALAVQDPIEAETKLSLTKLRKNHDFRSEWGFGLLLLFMSGVPLLLAILGFAGLPARDALGWMMWCVLPLFAALMWRVAPLSLQDRCPLCRRSTAGFESIVIATHKCPHCAGLIVEDPLREPDLLG